MIKEIFLPEKTKTRRLISQRIIGITIQENSVSAAQIYATSSSTFIERLQEEPIPYGAPNRYAERAADSITNILSRFSRYDQLRVAIQANIVTFKELVLPFTDLEKIKMVIEYEVEPMLPFSLNEAIIDFIITKQLPEKHESQILVAAVRKQDLHNIFDIYQQAGIEPTNITIDLFSLYGLYLQIPEYAKLPKASALIDIGTTSSSIAFLLNGELRLIRNIGKGISTIAEHISKETGSSVPDIIEQLSNFGTQQTKDEKYNQATQKQIIHFLNEIQFTLNSFSLKLNFYDEISKILFVGKGTNIKGFMDFSSTMLQIQCEYFSCNKLFKTKNFKNKTRHVVSNWTNYAIALGSALPYSSHDEFDLRKKEFATTHHPLSNKQIFTAGLLTLVIFFIVGIRGFFQINNLKDIARQKEQIAITNLKKVFPKTSPSRKKTRLNLLIKDAEQEIAKHQEAWSPFLQENLKPLEILHDLTQTMDRRLFNITIKKIAISIEEQGVPIITVNGLFKSKPGELFIDFGNFVKFFEQNSKILTLKEKPDEDLTEEGVEFAFTLKLKEKSE